MSKTRKALIAYVETASNLAESVKRNVQKDGRIDKKTILALNQFIIAANEIEHLKEELNNSDDSNESDRKLN